MLPDEYLQYLDEYSVEPSTTVSDQNCLSSCYRNSVSSFATMMTECSADAILPRESNAIHNRDSWQTILSTISALPLEYNHNLVYSEVPITPGPYGGRFPRDSVESFATIRTDISDNVISPALNRFSHRPASLCLSTFSVESNGTDLINTFFEGTYYY